MAILRVVFVGLMALLRVIPYVIGFLIIKCIESAMQVEIFVFEGGAIIRRMTPGSVGLDATVRAIVSASEMDIGGILRKTLYDFMTPPDAIEDEELRSHIEWIINPDTKEGEWAYRLDSGESILVGIGFAIAMPRWMFYWISPRSGLSTKYGITLGNAPGTADSDYGGECCANVVNGGDKKFYITRSLRIAQIIFQLALHPFIREVKRYKDLRSGKTTQRGAGGIGSTLLYGMGNEIKEAGFLAWVISLFRRPTKDGEDKEA